MHHADLATMSVDDLCQEVDRVTLARIDDSSSAANGRQATKMGTDDFERDSETPINDGYLGGKKELLIMEHFNDSILDNSDAVSH